MFFYESSNKIYQQKQLYFCHWANIITNPATVNLIRRTGNSLKPVVF